MSTTVTIANRKGGVGKTVTTWYTARWLARMRFRVEMRDADPQRGLWDIAEMLGHPDGVITRRLRLVDRIQGPSSADFVLIDTPPALDGSLPVLVEADYLLIPVIPEAQEVRQLEKFLNMLEATRQARPFTRILGVVPVRFIRTWEAHTAMLAEIEALASSFEHPIFPPVPMSKAVSRYSLAGSLWKTVAEQLAAQHSNERSRAA
jgi:cellulose biosynthesis protein BcsQ